MPEVCDEALTVKILSWAPGSIQSLFIPFAAIHSSPHASVSNPRFSVSGMQALGDQSPKWLKETLESHFC